MKISLLIPAMNRPKELEKCLKSVFSSTRIPDEIIVSDDSDKHFEKEILKICKSFKKVKYIKGPKKGLPANENHLLKFASNNFIVFLGDDNIVDRNYFQNMFKCYKKYSKIYGEKIIISGNEIRNGVEIYPGELTFLGYMARKPKDFLNIHSIVICSTLFPKHLFNSVRFDETYFYGYDEIDIALQAICKGYRIIFCPEIINFHNHSQVNREKYKLVVEEARLYEMLKVYSIYKRNILKFTIFFIISTLHIWIFGTKKGYFSLFITPFRAFKNFIHFYKNKR
uniref:Glycosyltransferase family 2 protein n=1 Tax=candidate division WOR-3 bacterium TaxID=2052148 RepID=A0A7C4YI06_UNCW3